MPPKRIEQVLKDKKISEIVNPKCVTAPPNTSVRDAVKLMQDNKSGYVIVVSKKKFLGIFTERMLVQEVMANNVAWTRSIGDFLDPHTETLSLQDSAGTAIDLMGQENLYYIALMNKDKELVNVISVRSLIRFLAAFFPNEVYNLPPRPDQVSTTPEGG